MCVCVCEFLSLRDIDRHRFLIGRLDQHGDCWREAPMGVLEENSVFQATPKSEKGAKGASQNAKEEKPKKGTKRKGAKADPNAPKRPANPFFQFCQEQRPRVMERLAGEPEPSKQELTRQLATTWKSLSEEDKKVNSSLVLHKYISFFIVSNISVTSQMFLFQVYYDMYERSKEKYVAEMEIYNKKTEDAPCQIPLNIT